MPERASGERARATPSVAARLSRPGGASSAGRAGFRGQDARGHFLDARGHFLDARGHFLDDRGKFLDDRGKFLEAPGHFLEARGHCGGPIDGPKNGRFQARNALPHPLVESGPPGR
jgi:hypothetical protein